MSRVRLIVAVCITPAVLAAQEPPGVEVGARAGVNFILSQGNNLTTVGTGGPGPLGSFFVGNTAVHVAFFPSPQIMVEPLLGIGVVSDGSESFANVTLAAQGAYLFEGATASSPYVGLTGGFNIFANTGVPSDTEFGVGGAVGYRALPRPNAALRAEAGYRRWLDSRVSELTIAVIFGLVL